MKTLKTAACGFFLIAALGLVHLAAQETDYPVTPDNQAQILNLGVVNTPYSEYTPFITADERYLFFQSNRPAGVNDAGDFDLWYTENEVTDGTPKFKVPGNVGIPVNSLYFDGHPTLRKLPTGDYEMYFASFAEEGRSGPQLTNIYYTIFKSGKWTVPTPVIEINTDFHDRMPSISQDGRYLFLSSDRPGGFGKDDIWISEYDFAAKRWSKPHNAGRTINTPASEVTPALHSDNITLYFSSNRDKGVGGYDIYVTQMLSNMPTTAVTTSDTETMWKKPINLGKPYNSEFDDEYPTVVRSGQYMYFASNRTGGQGSFDIYRGKVPEFAKPEVVVTLKGRVKEKFSAKGIEANIKISDVDGERNFSTHLPEGLYSADLINKKQYKLTVTAPGYRPIEYIADLRDVHTPVTIQKDFEMERVIALPNTLQVNISFVDETGKLLKPAATYRLSPDIKNDTILPMKKGIGKLQIAAMSKYKQPEDALAAFETMRLTVNGKLKGYQNAEESHLISELMRGDNGDLKATVELKIVMKAGETKTDVQVVECKAGTDCIAIAYFSTNVAQRLNNEKAAGLKKVVELWNKQPHKYVYVNGHADSRGSAAHNMKLSRARAAFVKKRLVQYGIPAEMIITKGFGEKQLATKDESSVAGRAKNRRAEIYFNATKRVGDEEPKAVKPKKKTPAKKSLKKDPSLPPEEVQPSTPAADDKIVPGAEGIPMPATKPDASPVTPSSSESPVTVPGALPKSEIKVQ